MSYLIAMNNIWRGECVAGGGKREGGEGMEEGGGGLS